MYNNNNSTLLQCRNNASSVFWCVFPNATPLCVSSSMCNDFESESKPEGGNLKVTQLLKVCDVTKEAVTSAVSLCGEGYLRKRV